MTINGNIVSEIMASLTSQGQFADLTFVVAYENDIKPIPLDKPIVALSTKGCQVGPKLTETLETGQIISTDKRELDTTMSLDIYMPYSAGGMQAHKIFDRIATYLLFDKKLDITKSTCNETECDKSCQAIVLKSQFVFHNIVSA